MTPPKHFSSNRFLVTVSDVKREIENAFFDSYRLHWPQPEVEGFSSGPKIEYENCFLVDWPKAQVDPTEFLYRAREAGAKAAKGPKNAIAICGTPSFKWRDHVSCSEFVFKAMYLPGDDTVAHMLSDSVES